MNLNKIQVPTGALRFEIDGPLDHCIAKSSGYLYGWFATSNDEIPAGFQFQVGSISLPYRVMRRPDVEEAMPAHRITGFEIRFDLFHYLPYIEDSRLWIRLTLAGHHPFTLAFTIQESALASCISGASG